MSTVRLRDVAAKVRLSPSLVSKVLNDRPGVWASAETRRRILTAAEELGYQPNAAARSLRSGKTHRVALVYLRPPYSSLHASGYSAVTEALACYLHDLDYQLIVQPYDTQEQVLAQLSHLARTRTADLVVLWGREGDVELQATHSERLGIPFVVKGRHERTHPEWPQVEFDHEAMMAAVVVRLTSAGHRRIAYIGHDADEPFRYRLLDGFQAAMAAATGEPSADHLVFHGSDFSREVDEVVARWFALPKARRPTAVAVAADSAAWEFLEIALARKGRIVGDESAQVAVAGNAGGPFRLLFGRGRAFDVDFFPLARIGCERLIGPLLRGEPLAETVVRYLPELRPTETRDLLASSIFRLVKGVPS